MNPDDLARILDELGERLGPTGEYVFALAVRQQVIENTVAVVFAVLVLVLGVALAIGATIRALRPDVGAGTLAVGLWAAFFIVFGLAVPLGRIANILNPEYAAIRDILAAIGGVR